MNSIKEIDNINLDDELIIKDKMKKFTILLGRANFEAKGYQSEGIEWCLRHELLRHELLRHERETKIRGGIVADEMGLGKTLMMIGLMFVNFKRRTLIIVPPVLLEQWAKEIYKCTGHKALKYHGHQKNQITEEQLLQAPIVITTYNMLLISKDKKGNKDKVEDKVNLLTKIKWNRLIFDEAHHLRNRKTERFNSCEKIRSDIKWLISGTPIQNKRSDLYNLCKIIGIKSVNKDNVKEIAQKYILRRTKAEVGINLPPVIKEDKQVPWRNLEEKLLSEELHALLPNQTGVFISNKSVLNDFAANFEGKGVLTAIMKARQSCIMPSLMVPDLLEQINTESIDKPKKYVKALRSSSKLDAVIELVVSRKDNGNGKIIFCHFRNEIDTIATRLVQSGLKKVVTYDGRNSRQIGVNIADAADAIILQIQTGCEGLNLQANFSEIYFVSPHWNPCVEDQAIARCHRIGQTKPTYVFKFEMIGFQKDNKRNKQDEDQDQNPITLEPITLEKYVNNVQMVKRNMISEVI